jgi:hypothetical protein
VKYVEEVVAIAEQTATGTQQVAGTARQLSSSMQELTSSSQRLSDIADDLQDGLETFQLFDYAPEPEPEPEPEPQRRMLRRPLAAAKAAAPVAAPPAATKPSRSAQPRQAAHAAAPATDHQAGSNGNGRMHRASAPVAETSTAAPAKKTVRRAKNAPEATADKPAENGAAPTRTRTRNKAK